MFPLVPEIIFRGSLFDVELLQIQYTIFNTSFSKHVTQLLKMKGVLVVSQLLPTCLTSLISLPPDPPPSRLVSHAPYLSRRRETLAPKPKKPSPPRFGSMFLWFAPRLCGETPCFSTFCSFISVVVSKPPGCCRPFEGTTFDGAKSLFFALRAETAQILLHFLSCES